MNPRLSSPLRSGASASVLLVLAAIASGCSTVSYRVPGLEVQRLANLPPQERGTEVRVVPETAPLYPSTQRLTPPPPPVVAPPPGPPVYGPDVVVEEEAPPEVVVEPNVYVDVEVPIGGHAHGGPPPHVVGARVAPPASGGGLRGSPPVTSTGGGGFRGSPPVTSTGGGGFRGSPVPRVSTPSGGWRGSPVGSAPRAPTHVSVPSGGHTRSGGHGGGGSGAEAAVGAAVLVVGLVAIAAIAANNAAEADRAHKFDGWVNVMPWHPVLLHYNARTGYDVRKVPLNQLRPVDTIGLEYGELSTDDGDIQLKPPAPSPAVVAPAVAARPRSPAPPVPATTTPAAAPPSSTPAPPATAPPVYQPAPPAAAAVVQPTS